MFKSDRRHNGVISAISGLIQRPAEKFANSVVFLPPLSVVPSFRFNESNWVGVCLILDPRIRSQEVRQIYLQFNDEFALVKIVTTRLLTVDLSTFTVQFALSFFDQLIFVFI